MRHFAVLVCWAACAARLWLTFVRGPRPIWRVSLTLSLTFVTLGATVRYEPWLVLNIPGFAEAASYFWLLLGVGMVNVYVDSLEQAAPSWRRSRRHIVTGVCLALLVVVSWLYIPDKMDSAGLAVAPMSLPLAVFILTADASLAVTLGRISRYCLRQIRDASRLPAPGERSGLALIGIFCGTGMLSFATSSLDAIVRLPTGAARSPHNPLTIATPIINATSLCGLAIGLFLLLAGPTLAVRGQRRQAALVRPFWEFLVRRHPEVHLEGSQRGLTRMRMEVHDALSLCYLPRTTPATPEAIVRGIIAGPERPLGPDSAVPAAHLVTVGHLTEADLAMAYNAATEEISCM